MSFKTQQEVLHEALAPHLATEQGQRNLAGGAKMFQVRSSLERENPAAAKDFSDLLLGFMWEEISVAEMQTKLKHLFKSNSCLKDDLDATLLGEISSFWNAPVESEAEQASAKKMICDLFGLSTHPSSKDFNQDSMVEAMRFMEDVRDRFESNPGKFEKFLHAGFGTWREGTDSTEVCQQQLKILEGNEDLVQRFMAQYYR